MSSGCRPWYKWWPKDFQSDEKVRALSPMAELIYRRVLDTMWESSECRLPNDIRFLHRVAAKELSFEEFKDLWTEIQYPGFEILKFNEKFVWSKRLREQFVECMEKSEKAKDSAEKRWGKKANAMRTQCEGRQNCDADTDTDTDIKKNIDKKKATQIPSDFQITASMRTWFAHQEFSFSVQKETDKFIDHAIGKGRLQKDWTAAWRLWMRKAQEYIKTDPKDNGPTFEEEYQNQLKKGGPK